MCGSAQPIRAADVSKVYDKQREKEKLLAPSQFKWFRCARSRSVAVLPWANTGRKDRGGIVFFPFNQPHEHNKWTKCTFGRPYAAFKIGF